VPKISELTSQSTPLTTDALPIVSSSTTKKATLGALFDTMTGFIQAGTGAVARTMQEKAREWRTPQDFGCVGDGVTDDTVNFQKALDAHRSIWCPGGSTYKITARLLMSNDNSALMLHPNVTLNVTGYTYNGTQIPFGNMIHITGENCSVFGMGPSSKIQITGACDGNGIGVLHKTGGYIGNLTLDGGKAGVTAIIDDTFQSGISLLNDTGANPTGTTGQYIVENVIVQNWTQYGVNVYGDISGDLKIRGCTIRDNGKAAEALSVGAGIVLTRGNKRVSVIDCTIYGNKDKGIFQSSAGEDAGQFTFTGNRIYDNGTSGIACTEEAQWASVSGKGTDGITITGNTIYGNGLHGVHLGTFDNVGFLKNVTVTGNVIKDNTSYGFLAQTNNHATDRTSSVTVSGNVITGNDVGAGIGGNNTSVQVIHNVITGNTTLDEQNLGGGGCVMDYNLTSAAAAWDADIVKETAGTFIPVDASGAGLAFGAGTAGTYRKHGKVVFAFVRVVYPVTANGANALIGGLPFTVANVDEASQGMLTFSTAAGGLATIRANANTQDMTPITPAFAAATNAEMSGSANMFTCIYPTSS
jgi:hypothetical protein